MGFVLLGEECGFEEAPVLLNKNYLMNAEAISSGGKLEAVKFVFERISDLRIDARRLGPNFSMAALQERLCGPCAEPAPGSFVALEDTQNRKRGSEDLDRAAGDMLVNAGALAWGFESYFKLRDESRMYSEEPLAAVFEKLERLSCEPRQAMKRKPF